MDKSNDSNKNEKHINAYVEICDDDRKELGLVDEHKRNNKKQNDNIALNEKIEENARLDSEQTLLQYVESNSGSIPIDVENYVLRVVDDDSDKNESTKEIELLLNELVRRVSHEDTRSQVKLLRKRSDQLNDVKQSIKQMNDQIRDELYIDFTELTTMLSGKLDEITNKIKERLKDAYTVVRDAQTRIIGRLDEVDAKLKYASHDMDALGRL